VRILLNHVPGPEHRDRLEAAAPGVEFTVATSEEEARAAIVEAEVKLGNRHSCKRRPRPRDSAGCNRTRWGST